MLGFGGSGERRQALVIGNSAYGMGPLANPKNDAGSISRILGELGFEVLLGLDLTRAEMEAIFESFEMRHADVALLYYSGHGGNVGGSIPWAASPRIALSGQRTITERFALCRKLKG
jgi:uncharacterized caspase-like protein